MTVRRKVAVEKSVKKSKVVNNKWIATDKKKTIEIENVKTKWGQRHENVLLYNKNTMNIVEADVMATVVSAVIVEGQMKQVNNKFNTHNKTQFIKDYSMEPVTQPQLEYYKTEEKYMSKATYPETVLDKNPVEWVDTEVEIIEKDVQIEVPNWELVLVDENSNEIPCVDVNSNKLVPVEYTSVHIDHDKVKQETVQEIYWDKEIEVKKVIVPVKRETTTSVEVTLRDCTEVKIDENEEKSLASKMFK